MESTDQKLVSTFFQSKDNWNRMCHTSTVYSHFVITFAGQNPEDGTEYVDLLVLDVEADTLQKINYTGDKILPRSSHSANLFDNNKIVIFGGCIERTVYEDMYVLTLEENAETKTLSIDSKKIVTKGAVLSRHNHYTFVYEDALYSYGGEDKQGNPQQGLWKLDLKTFTWSECTVAGKKKPKFMMKTAFTLCGHTAYFFGGIDSDDESVSADFWYLDLQNLKWHKIKSTTGTLPKERTGATLQAYKNKIYLYGGNFADEIDAFDDIHIYDPETNTWTRQQVRQEEENPIGRIYHTCSSYKNSLIIWGGFLDADFIPKEIFQINLEETTQTEKTEEAKEAEEKEETEETQEVKSE